MATITAKQYPAINQVSVYVYMDGECVEYYERSLADFDWSIALTSQRYGDAPYTVYPNLVHES